MTFFPFEVILNKFCLLNLVSLLLRVTAAPLTDCWVWEDVDPDPYLPPFMGPTTCNPSGDVTSTTPISTTPSQGFKECIRRCPKTPNYNPVCGSNGVTYGNDSKLKCAQKCGINVHKVFDGECSDRPIITTSTPSTTSVTPSDYPLCISLCPVTPQYNPICGTDGETYGNESKLKCAQKCGKNVEKHFAGRCSKPVTSTTTPSSITTITPISTTTPSSITTTPADYTACIRRCPATPEYNPVCATNGETFNNENKLKCAQRCGLNVQKQRPGVCSGRKPITRAPRSVAAV